VTRRRRFRTHPSGAAAVEFAVCLPILVSIVFGSIEGCSMIFLQQSLQTAAYEAARTAVRPVSSTAEAVNRGQFLLHERNVKSGNVSVEPSDVSTTPAGSQVTVTATAPSDANRILPCWFFSKEQLSASCTMLKE